MSHLGANGIDNMWEEWRDKFRAALDEVTPKVHPPIGNKKPRCPWMTPDLLNLIHKQKSMHRRVVRSIGTDKEAIVQHRSIRYACNTMYRNLKSR